MVECSSIFNDCVGSDLSLCILFGASLPSSRFGKQNIVLSKLRLIFGSLSLILLLLAARRCDYFLGLSNVYNSLV